MLKPKTFLLSILKLSILCTWQTSIAQFSSISKNSIFVPQVKEKFGELLLLKGWTVDEFNGDTLPLVSLHIYSGAQKLVSSQSDLDGVFYIWLCSSEILGDSITIQIDYPNYHSAKFNFSKNDLQDRVLEMRELDSADQDIIVELSSSVMNYCPDLRQMELDSNFAATEKGKTKYQHYCTGEIKTYNYLAKGQHDFNNWALLDSL